MNGGARMELFGRFLLAFLVVVGLLACVAIDPLFLCIAATAVLVVVGLFLVLDRIAARLLGGEL